MYAEQASAEPHPSLGVGFSPQLALPLGHSYPSESVSWELDLLCHGNVSICHFTHQPGASSCLSAEHSFPGKPTGKQELAAHSHGSSIQRSEAGGYGALFGKELAM